MNKGDMHNTKKIENKNDGIEEKIFTNSKKDRMEKKVQKKKHTQKLKAGSNVLLGFDHRNVLGGGIETFFNRVSYLKNLG